MVFNLLVRTGKELFMIALNLMSMMSVCEKVFVSPLM